MSGVHGQGGLLSPDSVLHRAADRLANQFSGAVRAETAERVEFESYAALDGIRAVRDEVQLRVERLLRELAPTSA